MPSAVDDPLQAVRVEPARNADAGERVRRRAARPPGPDRWRTLTPADFDTGAATVTLSARFNKSRKLKVQPLPSDVAAALREYLADKPAAVPVWGGTWRGKAAEMLRADLEAADLRYTPPHRN